MIPNPSKCSIAATMISFVVLMLYYYHYQPDFVMAIENSQKVFSLRLSMIYALLFSSATGLLVLGVLSIAKSENE